MSHEDPVISRLIQQPKEVVEGLRVRELNIDQQASTSLAAPRLQL
jgi:hypothetical protein